MKIQIASDLHFELWERHLPDPLRQFTPDTSRDLLILAGDIVDGRRLYGMPFIQRELEMSPVIFVPGNHEYYHARRQEVEAFWRGFADDNEGFYYLNDDTAEIAGLRFYGAEWCSDFWGEPPILFHDRIADFHLTPGLGYLRAPRRAPAHHRTHRRPGREAGHGRHPFPAHAGSH